MNHDKGLDQWEIDGEGVYCASDLNKQANRMTSRVCGCRWGEWKVAHAKSSAEMIAGNGIGRWVDYGVRYI